MNRIILAIAVLAFVVPMITPTVQAQENHPPIYLWNGYQTTSTSTTYWRGFYINDMTTTPPKLTKLFDPPYYTQFGSACMDWNNKDLIFATSGSSSAGTQYDGSAKVYRWDTTAKTLSTIITLWRAPSGTYPYGYQYCYDNILIDQDGNYLFSFYQYKRVNTPTTVTQYTRGVLKYDTAAKTLSTILTSLTFTPPYSTTFGYLTKDIDSGKVLGACYRYMTTPSTMKYPVWSLNPEDGYNVANLGLWNDGSAYGWYPYSYNFEQNVHNGYFQGPYYSVSTSGGRVYQLMPGSAGMTTLTSIANAAMPFPGSTNYLYTGKFDLQTASKPSWKCSAYYYSKGSGFVDFDAATWAVNSSSVVATSLTQPGKTSFYSGQFDFWGGRHLQTVKVSANKWAVLVSVPHLPGKKYAMAATFAGVRPGILLPKSGRNINMNWDTLMYLTLTNQIPNLWNPGPLTLDANGNARGSVDINPLKPPKDGFGIALWIGVVVMDPAAPDGVAYCPDTYVMRI